jgi:hypothetical protein
MVKMVGRTITLLVALAAVTSGVAADDGQTGPSSCDQFFEEWRHGECVLLPQVQKGLKFHEDVRAHDYWVWADYLTEISAPGGILENDKDFSTAKVWEIDTFVVVDVGEDPEGRYHLLLNIRFESKVDTPERRERRETAAAATPSPPSSIPHNNVPRLPTSKDTKHAGALPKGHEYCAPQPGQPAYAVCCTVGYGAAQMFRGSGSGSGLLSEYECADCSAVGSDFYSDTSTPLDAAHPCQLQTQCGGATGTYYANRATSSVHEIPDRCTPMTECRSFGLLESEAGTDFSDRVCGEPIKHCTQAFGYADHYFANYNSVDFPVVGEWRSQPVCKPLAQCEQGEFWSNKALSKASVGYTADRECTKRTPCAAGKFVANVAVQHLGDHLDWFIDNECKPDKTCGDEEFISVPGTATSDRVCQTASLCNSMQYEALPKTATSDRICKAITVCDVETQYQATDATETSDAVCKPVTECVGNEQFLLEEKTGTSDRTCGILLPEDEASPQDVEEGACKSFCFKATGAWARKCGWKNCQKCQQCDSRELAKEAWLAEKQAGECANNNAWRKGSGKHAAKKNCNWVAKKPQSRCDAVGADGTRAQDACPMPCRTECSGR